MVEILSPATAATDRVLKAQIYAAHGVDYYWLADPDGETLEEYQRQGDVFVRVATYQGPITCSTRCLPGLYLDLGQGWG